MLTDYYRALVGLSCCAGLLTGCSVDLKLPNDVDVACTSSSDCPPDYACAPELGRCFPKGDDIRPIGVVEGSLHVTPTAATRGTRVVIELEVDAPVGAAPSASIAWGGRSPGARDAVLLESSLHPQYRFEYVVGEQESEGWASISLRLYSSAGVASESSLPQALSFDFTPPSPLDSVTVVTLVPQSDALILRPTAATVGTTIEILFGASEPLGDMPVISFAQAPTERFACDEPIGVVYRCTYTVPATAWASTQGDADVEALLVDAAGNSATVPLSTVLFDFVPPAPAASDVPNLILYQRVPYGAEETGGERRFTLNGGPAAVEPNATVVAWDGADVTSAAELGRTTSNADGSFASFPIASANRPRVFLSVVDGAGNESDADPLSPGPQASRVESVEWLATLAGKVAFSEAENPHHLRARTWFGDSLVQSDALDLADDGALARLDGTATAETLGAGQWALEHDPSLPSAGIPQFAFDTWRGVVVMIETTYAGISLWEWNGDSWRAPPQLDLEEDGSPAGRRYGAVAFDERLGRTVLYGGKDLVEAPVGDMWGWDGLSWKHLTSPNHPPACAEAAMAYDPEAMRLALVCGSADVWLWDGSDWSKVAATGPLGRDRAKMAYDHTRHELVLWGGRSAPVASCPDGMPGGACVLRDTWTFTLAGGWVKRCDNDPANTDCPETPYPENSFALADDAARGRVVLFGGRGDQCPHFEGYCKDVIEWTGTAWVRPSVIDDAGDGSPNERYEPALVFDPFRRELLLLGGENDMDGCDGLASASCDQIMWSWDGTEWRRRIDATSPTPPIQDRRWAQLTYRETDKEYLLFGGCLQNGTPCDGITWRFSGSTWTQGADSEPSGRKGHVMQADANGKVLLFGGSDRDLTEYNDAQVLTGTSWSVLALATKPNARRYMASTFDSSARQALVIYGGDAIGHGSCPGGLSVDPLDGCRNKETWGLAAWGTATCGNEVDLCWQLLDAQGPRKLEAAAMAYDKDRDTYVMFGGLGYDASAAGSVPSASTWEWTGSAWEEKATSGPRARSSHAMVYDRTRRKTVLFGGAVPYGQFCGENWSECADLWEWDGASWTPRLVADPTKDGRSPARSDHAMLYDPDRDETIVLGQSPLSGKAAFWAWRGGAAARPGQAAEFALASTGEKLSGIELERVSARWSGSGFGYPNGIETAGVELFVWREGAWQSVALAEENGLASWCVRAPSSISSEEPDCPVLTNLSGLFVGTKESVNLGMRPRAPNGRGIGRFASDYLEVRVRYRLASP